LFIEAGEIGLIFIISLFLTQGTALLTNIFSEFLKDFTGVMKIGQDQKEEQD
jgi:hypothetical protein